MLRKNFWSRRRMLLTLFVAAALVFIYLVKYEPSFYETSHIPQGSERAAQSGQFLIGYGNLLKINEQTPDWSEEFTTNQINAFLQNEFVSESGNHKKLPDGFSDLRVQVEEGKLLIGCRYGKGVRSTILSLEAKVWLVEDGVNLIGVELTNAKAGALPVSRDIVLDYISEAAARSHIEVSWRYRDDNPVAILRFQANKERPTIQIQRLELRPGRMVVAGRSVDAKKR
ncbi:MAG: hypothetical protein K8T89_15095 [Planctomycetes bacterium]|nr:hypothetical protein [Planctomycetota bacterium]